MSFKNPRVYKMKFMDKIIWELVISVYAILKSLVIIFA